MTEEFFKNFPKINYSNTICVDITQRVKVIDSIADNPFIYYPYSIENNERHDQLAESFWSDHDLNWLIFISNEIIDPYYQWYLQDNELTDLIIKKYGSIEAASQKTKYYRVIDSDQIISVSQYNALAPTEFKYYEGYFEVANVLVGYKRRSLDWKINTNLIVEYTIDDETGFNVGDKLKIKIKPETLGTAEIILVTSGKIYAHHIVDNAIESDGVEVDNDSYVYVDDIETDLTAIRIVSRNIEEDEFKYWEPVSYLQSEIDDNEYNRTLRILNKDYVPQVLSEFKGLLK